MVLIKAELSLKPQLVVKGTSNDKRLEENSSHRKYHLKMRKLEEPEREGRVRFEASNLIDGVGRPWGIREVGHGVS